MALKPFNSVAGYSVGEVPANIILANGDITTTNITMTGVSNLNSVSNVKISGGSAGQVLATDGAGNLSFITVSTTSLSNGTSNISIINSGNITFSVAGSANVGVFTSTGLNVSGTLNATGNANVGNIGATGVIATTLGGSLTTATQPNITSVGILTSLAVTGNATVGNVYANSGTIGASLLIGTLTTAAQPNITSVGTLGSLTVTNKVTAGQLQGEGGNISNIQGANVSGTVSSATTASTVTTASQPNITSVGTLTGLSVNGNIIAANITANTGVFTGNGSGLSAIVGANVTGTVANATFATSAGSATTAGTVTTAAQPNITSVGTLSSLSVTGNANVGNIGVNNAVIAGSATFGGNVNMGNFNIINLGTPVNPSDAATKEYVDSVAEGLHIQQAVDAATPDTLANISGGTVTYNNGNAGIGANLVTTGTYTAIDGYTLNTSDRVLVKNEANTAHNGIYVVTSSTVLTRATDYDTDAEIAGGDFVFVTNGTLYNSTGWVQIDPVNTIGTDPIVWEQFSGAGTYLAGTGLTLTGTTFSVNTAQPTITSVGTLTGLNVNGNITAANITANTGVFTGNGAGLTNIAGANVTGQVGNALVAGTVYTAAQPNITSVGTLTSLTVSGNANVGNIGATNFVGSGASLTSLNASNLASGTVPSARLSGTYTINISGSATTAGTVTTAAQPNITSVGTLSSLTVSGNVSTGNISGTNGNLTTANVSGNLILGNASVTTAISYGSVTTTAITANQTIASFSATGVTGVEFLVKSIDSAGSKYGVATVVAVTDGTNVDYSTFATVNLGGYTGALAVNIVGGQVRLQVTPASSNSTVWTTQYRLI